MLLAHWEYEPADPEVGYFTDVYGVYKVMVLDDKGDGWEIDPDGKFLEEITDAVREVEKRYADMDREP